MRKRHLEFLITRRLTSLDICALTMLRIFNYSNYNTGEENKIMGRNKKSNTINWSAHEMMVLITS